MKTIVLASFLAAAALRAQAPGTMATQELGLQAAQQAQQESMATGQMSLQGMQQLTQSNQLATEQMLLTRGINPGGYNLSIPAWNAWKVGSSNYLSLSVKPGTVKPGTQVRIRWRGGEYAAVYYTLDGWSPSPASTLYTGPITIDGPVHLQAIALGLGSTRTPILDAEYNVPLSTSSPERPVVATDGILRAGTVLQLKTAAEVSSNTAKQGDKVPLVLDQDVTANGAVVIPRGTAVDAVLTQVAPTKGPHHPAMLILAVRSIQGPLTPLKLLGIETMQGALGRNSGPAVIPSGMTMEAKVAADTKLQR